ncbi:MAG TPA: HlyD family secretion protein [Terriglobales bacterium]|nr:HlyD family secretion protein [Terriglobales bacterium]
MADSKAEARSLVEVEQPAPIREPWPEEVEEPSRRARARSYFREHPGAKWILLVALLVLVVAVFAIWSYYAARETTDDAQIDAHIIPISARVGGTVIKINFNDNQYVPAGVVLIQLDPTDYQVALERARANLQDAVARAQAAHTGVPVTSTTSSSQLQNAQAALRAAQQQVDAARAQLRDAEARYALAVQDLERYKRLVERDEIPRQQYDTALTNEQRAAASVDAAKAAVADAQSRVQQAESQVESAMSAPKQVAISRSQASAADAQVAVEKAALSQAELNLQYTTIRAPVNGIVSKRTVELGEVIQAGQPLVADVNLDDIWATANYKETQLKYMRPGQPATIHVDTNGRDYRGHVDSFGGATGARFSLLPPENATGNYVKVVQRIPVKLVFEGGQDPQHLLRPGMSVEPTVRVK